MSTYNICFCGKVRKVLELLGLKKVPYLELCKLSITVFIPNI